MGLFESTFNAVLNPSGAAWVPVADAVLKATLLLATAGLASAALHRASAALRHSVWTLALISALALPALSMVLPRWQIPVVTLASPAMELPVSLTLDTRPPPLRRTTSHETQLEEHTPALLSRGRLSEVGIRRQLADVSWQFVLCVIWMIGMLAILGRLGAGVLAVQWMSRRTQRVTDAPWLPLAREVSAELGAPSRLIFLRSARTTMPMAWGVVRPAVLMPADVDRWPLDRLRIVLLHELAHVKRRDCLTHMIAQLACALYWFNPLAWIAARHLRTERERACDDLVIAAGTRGSVYAEELLQLARAMRAGRFPAVLAGATLAMAHRSQLEGRLMAILDPNMPRARMTRRRIIAATAVFACAVMPLASLQPWGYAATSASIGVTPVTRDIDALQSSNVPAPSPAPTDPKPQPRPPAQAERPIESHPGHAAADALADAAREAVVHDVAQGITQGMVQGVVQGMLAAHANANANTADDKDVDETVGRSADQNPEPKPEHARKGTADPKLVAALTAALKDNDKDVRETALHALVQMHDPSVFEPLVQALRDVAPDVREQAAHGLGQLKDRRAIEPLTAALRDQSASVREQVVFALGQLRDPRVAESLAAALKDTSPDVREQAAHALGELRDQHSVDALTGALKDENANVREQAAFALGQLRDRRAVTALTSALKDVSDDVREQVVFALGQLRDVSAIEGLGAALRDQKADVREQAAFALGQLRDRRAVEPLISALKDSAADVREQAAFALGQIRDRGAVEALVIALKDADADVREQVAFALGQLRDPRAIDALTAALKDASASVRQQAAFALGQLAR